MRFLPELPEMLNLMLPEILSDQYDESSKMFQLTI